MAPLTNPASNTAPSTTGYVDVAAGIALLGGNYILYEQVARSFLEEIRTLPTRLALHLRSPALDEAARLLHTIKGLAMTVGAVQLGETCRAGELEIKKALDQGNALDEQRRTHISKGITESVATTTEVMQGLLVGMAPAAVSAKNAGVPAAQDTTALLADLQQLHSLLSQSDMRAVDVHQQLMREHGPAARGQLDRLNAAMSAFDFERGVVQCGELICALSATH